MNTQIEVNRSRGGERAAAGVACKILLAEDCPDTVRLLQTYLNDPRIAVTVATTGREAVAAFQEADFDLVLMDIELPDMDGYAAMHHIREWEASQMSSRTPIAALTARSGFNASRDILAAGFAMHLAKPITRQTLLQIVSQFGAHPSARRGTVSLRQTFHSNPPVAQEGSVDAAVRALLPEYLMRLNENVLEMKAAMHDRQYGIIRTFAHQMKGNGSAFGFPKVTEYGREIERAAAKADEPMVDQQLSRLCQYLSQVSSEWSFSVQAR